MSCWTVYIDESGSFSKRSEPLGARVVAAVALQGKDADLSPAVTAAIRESLDWWQGPWHATELTHGRRFVKRLHEAGLGTLPDASMSRIHGVFERARRGSKKDCALRERWKRMGAALRDGVAHGVADLLSARGGFVGLSIQHDRATGENRYPEMLDAALTWTLVDLVREHRAEAVELVVASRGDLRLEEVDARVGEAMREMKLDGVRVQLRAKDALEPGPLFLADWVAYALGPRWQVEHPVPEGATRTSIGALEKRLSMHALAGRRVTVAVAPTGRASEITKAGIAGRASLDGARAELRELMRTPPAGEYTVSAAEGLRRLEKLGRAKG